MKIAIFHNFMDNIGGAEIVTLTLARDLDADIYTTNFNREKIKKMGFNPKRVFTLGKVPVNAPFRQQFALSKFRKLNLKNKYDLYIIAGDWAISGAVLNKPNIEYFHSPLNEIWAFKDHIRNIWLSPWKRPLFDVWVLYNRFIYRKYFKHVQKRIANSKNTQSRIKKFLDSDSIVIPPPVETKKYKSGKSKNYWLSVNRLFNHKRVDMQIEAFKNLPNEKLVIVGSYEKSKTFLEHANYIKKIKPENVDILSFVDYGMLLDLYSHCKGFIATAINEDFGMTLIEAMASGKPVIASNEGGYKESVINNKTGILIDNINEDKLANAIKKINKQLKNNPNKYKAACIKQAKKFDTKEFIKKIKEQIKA